MIIMSITPGYTSKELKLDIASHYSFAVAIPYVASYYVR